MRIPPNDVCRHGHPMAEPNLLWHTRYDNTGKRFLVRECRACSNERYRARRRAKRRNQELGLAAVETSPGFLLEISDL